MDDALATWLRLREPADAEARSLSLTGAIATVVNAQEPIAVLDLGCGSGANLRYLAPRLGGHQRWLLVDTDPALLALAVPRTAEWASTLGGTVVATDANGRFVIRGSRFECHVETQRLDLDTLNDTTIFAGRHLVTASALLDLTSDRWMRALAARCRASGAAALFALTYDGSSFCAPAEPEDDWIRDLLNRHQTRDKGLGGPAAGPGAADVVVRAFEAEGYHVDRAASPWRLDESAGELQRQLIEGWADAATEMVPDEAAAIAHWLQRRLAHLDANRSRVIVGHVDVAAWDR